MSSSQPSDLGHDPDATTPRIRHYGLVALGGLAGSAVRSGIGQLMSPERGVFPITTLLVNIGGSFLLGYFLANRRTQETSVAFWASGVFASLTTFSTFSFEVVLLLDVGLVLEASMYVLASVTGGLGAFGLGRRFGTIR